MVFRSTDAQGPHLMSTGNAPKKRPESFLQLRCDQLLTVFGAEHAMKTGAHVRHNLSQPSLRDLGNYQFRNPALKRRAILTPSLRDFRRRTADAIPNEVRPNVNAG